MDQQLQQPQPHQPVLINQAMIATLVQQAVQASIQAIQQPGAGGKQHFTSSNGLKLFTSLMMPFTVKSNGDQKKLQHFLSVIKDRAESFRWSPILDVQVSINDVRSITKQFGTLMAAQVTAHAQTYLPMMERTSKL